MSTDAKGEGKLDVRAEERLERAEVEVREAAGELKAAERDLARAEHDLVEAEAERHEIYIFVDGERHEVKKRDTTPNEIIREFGGALDPSTHYLVRIKGHEKISFQGKGNEPIRLHNDERFQIISIGPTPVSDAGVRTGVAVFIDGLRTLGYEPKTLGGKPNHVVIDYTVETGRNAGQKVRLGFIVPQDFPMTPPSGPHVSPAIHSLHAQVGPHPTCGVHASPDFEKGAAGKWQYWSRPNREWAKGKKTVAAYMSHVWRLWDSQ